VIRRPPRAAVQRFIDRDPQYLPVPIGGTEPVRVLRRGRAHALRAHGATVAGSIGMAAAAFGLLLLSLPEPPAAYLEGDTVHIGAMSLSTVGAAASDGSSLYTGAAALVLREGPAGSAEASAAWVENGAVASGRCTVHPDGQRLIDECVFAGAGGAVTSVDVLDPAAGSMWQRTYSDGARTTFPVGARGGAIPVPFPIGR
jgi:hypothetical protein